MPVVKRNNLGPRMRRRADPAAGDDAFGIGVDVREKLLDRLCRNRKVRDKNNGIRTKERDGGGILDVVDPAFLKSAGPIACVPELHERSV